MHSRPVENMIAAAPAQPRFPRPALVIMLAGIALRIVYCAGNDVRHVHDDHFHVIKIMLEERRWPRPDEGWETFQPPLYHALGAVTYAGTHAVAGGLGAKPQNAHAAGRKAVQFISAVAGSLTLILVWLILRAAFPGRRNLGLLGLTVAAFLPRHVYMSGMATNDALCYLWTAATIWGLVRWFERPASWRWAWVAGGAAGLALLTKGYALATFGVLVCAIPLAIVRREAEKPTASGGPDADAGCAHVAATRIDSRSRAIGTGCVMAAVALVIGVWPYVRNARLAGSPFATSVEIIDNTMRLQPPGNVSGVSFASFRLPALLDRPWLHVSTLDSFWTEIYARTWFDYGTSLTLFHYEPFALHTLKSWAMPNRTPKQRVINQLTWDLNVTPRSEAVAGRALYVLGLLPTAMLVIGVVVGFWRIGRDPANALHALNVVANVAIPLGMTLRLPHYASMKATYALGAMASGAVLVAVGAEALGWHQRRWLRRVVVLNLILLAGVLATHLVHIAYFPPEYFIAPTDTL